MSLAPIPLSNIGGTPVLQNGTPGASPSNNGPTPAQMSWMAGQMARVNAQAAPSTPTPTVNNPPAQQPPQVDPNAAANAARAAAAAKATANFNSTRDSTYNSINESIGQAANDYNSGQQDYLDGRRIQQNTIDTGHVQNELSREQGMNGILDMVGNGIRSTGVQLSNANAGSSSAVEAAAHAYGVLGRQQATSVGNQFAQGENKVNTDQNNLTLGDQTQARHDSENKTRTINSIVTNARQQIAYLNQTAMYASLPDRIDIEAKINEIKQNSVDALSKYDGVLSDGLAKQGPMAQPDVQSKAHSLLVAGTAPENAYSYQTEAPAQLSNSGPFASSLPIFLAPNKRSNQ